MPAKKKSEPLLPPIGPTPKAHPWRECPGGEHWVREHPLTVPANEDHDEYITTRRGHCATNPSKKDQLYPDEVEDIAIRYFNDLKGGPQPYGWDFGEKANQYDSLIRGWTQYWNEVFQPNVPLDSDSLKL